MSNPVHTLPSTVSPALDPPLIPGIASGAGVKVGHSDKDGNSLGTDKRPKADVTVISPGVPPGTLSSIIHSELLVGAEVGGKMGSMATPISTPPGSLSPSVLSVSATLLVVIGLASTHTGTNTSGVTRNTDHLDTIEHTLVPPRAIPMTPVNNTVNGTRAVSLVHSATKTVVGKTKKAELATHASAVARSPHPHLTTQGRRNGTE